MSNSKPTLYTSPSPALLDLYEINNAIVVIIDVFRATSTIATALYNGAKCIIPVDSVAKCIELGRNIEAITAGERDGKIAEGLSYGNSPFEYSKEFIGGKTLVLTTTNGTKLLHMALERGSQHIITGSFPNLSAVCEYLVQQNLPVVLGCSAWKDRVNLEDMLFAGAVIHQVKEHFSINCDSSAIAETLYKNAKSDMYEFLKEKNATHYQRLTNFGLEKDMRYCLTPDIANILPFYEDGKLVIHNSTDNRQ
jgi:2-phosphosulfolactate phosphatase